MMKLSDYVAQFLATAGLKHVFMLTGGGAMHLNDSFGRNKALEVVCLHHEQACAMAAESYARLSNRMAVVNVTTGPGGINALNGVFGAWTDSIPMFVVSGQVRYDTTVPFSGLNLRQMGDQECDIVHMVSGITKYAITVVDPKLIRYHLEKAFHTALHGRPGPVWIDIPMNVQGSMIDENNLLSYTPTIDTLPIPKVSDHQIQLIVERLKTAKRPIILAGAGVRLSHSEQVFLSLIEHMGVPVTTGWNAHDLLPDAHPLNVGKPGTIGDRAGNFAVQNSDFILILGSRLNIRQISYNYPSFARAAFKVMVDADANELVKPTLKIDQPIWAELPDFLNQLLAAVKNQPLPSYQEWLTWCLARKKKYPVVLPEYWKLKERVNPYCFMDALSDLLPENQVVVTGDGTACVTFFQAVKVKKGQRIYTNSGSASMGYDLPGAMGACVAAGQKEIICLAGDGSLMQNIQELAAVAFQQYPIKIFILNNNGYHSIRQTQQNFFGKPLVGVGPDSGLGFPAFSKLAEGFGIAYLHCDGHADLKQTIEKTLQHKGPVICEIILDLEQQFAPKLSSRRLENGQMVTSPLEDMAPFLSREELAENMLIEK